MSDAPGHGPTASRRRWTCGRWALALLLGLAVCGVGGALVLFVNAWLLPVADEASLQEALRGRAEEARQVWAALDGLWGRLEAGQAVHCRDETVQYPYFVDWRAADRAAYPDLARLADQLNGAIRDLHRAADAWTAACQSGEAVMGEAVAAEARAALTRADEGLQVVMQALSVVE